MVHSATSVFEIHVILTSRNWYDLTPKGVFCNNIILREKNDTEISCLERRDRCHHKFSPMTEPAPASQNYFSPYEISLNAYKYTTNNHLTERNRQSGCKEGEQQKRMHCCQGGWDNCVGWHSYESRFIERENTLISWPCDLPFLVFKLAQVFQGRVNKVFVWFQGKRPQLSHVISVHFWVINQLQNVNMKN